MGGLGRATLRAKRKLCLNDETATDTVQRFGSKRVRCRRLGSFLDLGNVGNSSLDIPERKALEKNTAAVRSQLGEDAFKAVYAEGHIMTVDAAVEYALGST